MSTSETIAKRGRGRPKKVIEDTAEDVQKTGTRKASTKAAKTTKGPDEVVKKVAKTASKASKTVIKKAAELKPAKTTPAAPSTSKILQEVTATGTFKSVNATATAAPSAPSSPSSRPPISKPAQPTATTSKVPPPPQPQRVTTIPLPTKPVEPSTHRPLPYRSPPTSTPTPTPVVSEAPKAAPKPPSKPEPVLIGEELPKKYKPAARRVTAIIVAMPIIIVVGIELWRRWDKQIRNKYEFIDVTKRTETKASS